LVLVFSTYQARQFHGQQFSTYNVKFFSFPTTNLVSSHHSLVLSIRHLHLLFDPLSFTNVKCCSSSGVLRRGTWNKSAREIQKKKYTDLCATPDSPFLFLVSPISLRHDGVRFVALSVHYQHAQVSPLLAGPTSNILCFPSSSAVFNKHILVEHFILRTPHTKKIASRLLVTTKSYQLSTLPLRASRTANSTSSAHCCIEVNNRRHAGVIIEH